MAQLLFQSSDLQKHRRKVLDAGRTDEGAVVRDTDGTTLLLLPKVLHDGLEVMVEMTQGFLVAAAAIDRDSTRASEFGSFAWMVFLDADDRKECLFDLRDALALLANGNRSAFEDVLEAWRITATELSDELRRTVLLGKLQDDDFEEVDRPV